MFVISIYITFTLLAGSFFYFLLSRFKNELYTIEVQNSKLQYQLKQDMALYSIHLSDSIREFPDQSYFFNRLYIMENILSPFYQLNRNSKRLFLISELHELLHKWSYLKNLSFTLHIDDSLLLEPFSLRSVKLIKNLIIIIANTYQKPQVLEMNVVKNGKAMEIIFSGINNKLDIEKKINIFFALNPLESLKYYWTNDALSITLQINPIETSKCLSI